VAVGRLAGCYCCYFYDCLVEPSSQAITWKESSLNIKQASNIIGVMMVQRKTGPSSVAVDVVVF